MFTLLDFGPENQILVIHISTIFIYQNRSISSIWISLIVHRLCTDLYGLVLILWGFGLIVIDLQWFICSYIVFDILIWSSLFVWVLWALGAPDPGPRSDGRFGRLEPHHHIFLWKSVCLVCNSLPGPVQVLHTSCELQLPWISELQPLNTATRVSGPGRLSDLSPPAILYAILYAIAIYNFHI